MVNLAGSIPAKGTMFNLKIDVMNEKQIIEGNKLIAGFMGFEYIESDGFWLDDGSMLVDLAHRTNDGIEFTELLFHESWDWLMPVVEKINSQGYSMEGVKFVKNIAISAGGAYLQATYSSVIDFITWFNKNK